MEPSLKDTTALLTRTPAALDALLRGLPESWINRNEGGETWTIARVIAHLVHCEITNWMPRVHWILEFNDSKPFEPFERVATTRASSFADELDEFSHLRTENLFVLDSLHLSEADLDRPGLHPGLGPVKLSQVLATWAVHDMTHLHQVSRILAWQGRNSVGPWSKYLGVLHCQGHSASD